MKQGQKIKKWLSFLLSVTLLLPLTACSGTPAESSDSATDSSTEETSSEESEDTAVQKAAFYDTVATDCYYENILLASRYTLNREAYDHFADDGVKLTDGEDASTEDQSTWLGFGSTKDIVIDVDLGGLQENLAGFSLDFLNSSNPARGIPNTVELWASEDGETYALVTSSNRYPEASTETFVYTHQSYTQQTFRACKIRVVITDIKVAWTLMDNLCLYRLTDAEEVIDESDYYENRPFNPSGEAVYFDSTDADYKTTQNLLLGLEQRVYLGQPLSEELKTTYYNTPASYALLTDGKTGGTNYMDSAYFHVTRGYNRTFLYDLGAIGAVSSATVDFYVYEDYAIMAPDGIRVQLSENGTDWQTVAKATAGQYPAAVNDKQKVTLDFGGTYRARYVRIIIMTSNHHWLDEFEVWGTKNIPSDALTVVGESEDVVDIGYPTADQLDGCENILLAYNYKVENRSVGQTTKEEYLPYVGYYNTDGELTDYFFDAYLYLPCSTTCPSGGRLYTESGVTPSVMTDWLDYENDVFADGVNVQALEEAVEEIKTQLGDEDYQVKVFLSIFCPNETCSDFGDVDGDGISEDLTKQEDRRKVIRWWIDRQVERYTSQNFQNQKLIGFYWYDENLRLSNPANKDSVTYALEYVHSLGYKAIWIPYYQASGFSDWESIGFDVANMQPNYMFTPAQTQQLLYDNAQITKQFGMGVEIEISGNALSTDEYYRRYIAYLYVGAETGYMNGIKMYYQDAGPGVFYNAYRSEDEKQRSVYDLTYQFAKGTLKVSSSDGGTVSFTAAKNESYRDTLTLESMIIVGASVRFSPMHGTVAVGTGGEFIYTPDAGYTGEDSFTVTVTKGFSTCDVNVQITVA